MVMQIDLHRAGLGASATKRRRVGEVFPIHQTAQVRRNNRADRPLVSGRIGVAADIPVNRANVQTSSATDAVERIPLLGISQQLSSSIVQKDNMKFLWPIGFAWLTRAADQGVVAGYLLASTGGR